MVVILPAAGGKYISSALIFPALNKNGRSTGPTIPAGGGIKLLVVGFKFILNKSSPS